MSCHIGLMLYVELFILIRGNGAEFNELIYMRSKALLACLGDRSGFILSQDSRLPWPQKENGGKYE